MKRSKSLVLFLVGMLLLSLVAVAGCGNKEGPPQTDETSTPAPAPKVIQVAHVSSPDMNDPYHRFAANFAENVAQRSNGTIKIEVITGGQFGQEREMFEGMKIGTVDMGVMTNSYASVFVPAAALFDLPFLFPDYDTANRVLDGPVGQKVLASFKGSGVEPLAWGVGGFRHLVTNGSGARVPSDLVGKKIRSMETKMYMATYKALGVNAVPMAYSETIPGLQQKTIDGVDLPLSVLAANRFYELADYISMTGHFYSPLILCMSDSVWKNLSSEQQNMVKEAAVDAGNELRDFIAENELVQLQVLKDNGMKAVEDVDYGAFQEALATFYEEQKTTIGSALVDELMAALEELKK
ncbi:MAG: TRAP transporter substrate-binding protein [Bacillota bacterium]